MTAIVTGADHETRQSGGFFPSITGITFALLVPST
jgi:hypothetical protein